MRSKKWYCIKEVEKIDDYAMIGEVLNRRYNRLIREQKRPPDLIIIDGGKGHVQTAKERLTKLGFYISVIVIAKLDESLCLIQRIRDEAYRFSRRCGVNLFDIYPAFARNQFD